MSKPMKPIFDDAFWAKVIAASHLLVGKKTFAFGGLVWVQRKSEELKQ